MLYVQEILYFQVRNFFISAFRFIGRISIGFTVYRSISRLRSETVFRPIKSLKKYILICSSAHRSTRDTSAVADNIFNVKIASYQGDKTKFN